MKIRTIVAGMILIPIAAWGGGKDEKRYSDAHFALGTVCTITLFGENNADAFQGAFDLVDDLEAKMSVSIASSEVAAINNSAGIAPVEVSADTFHVIEQALAYFEVSDGKFDVTVQPLVELWGIGTELARVPELSEIEAAIALTGTSDVELDSLNSTVFLKREGMAIDLGGIAKGYAADQVKKYLTDRGVSRGILNFGGNIVTFGEKPDGTPWIIGIQDPYDSRGNPVATVNLSESSVVTSGIYERYFEQDGRRYHHILDPDTGYPVENELMSITIVGVQGIVADVFSTIVFALGVTKGAALLESKPSLEGVFIMKSHDIVVTSGLSDVFSISNSKYEVK